MIFVSENGRGTTGESAELPPGGGAIILARLRSEGGQVKSFSFFHWCVRGGGRLEIGKNLLVTIRNK